MKTITLLSKSRVISANQLKLPLQPTLLVSTQTSFFEICTNGLLPFIFLLFCFQDLFSKFSNLLSLLVPGGNHFLQEKIKGQEIQEKLIISSKEYVVVAFQISPSHEQGQCSGLLSSPPTNALIWLWRGLASQ
ncbi:hypothetical protein CMV_010816 [Castanea mollissima]|uniref:Uncharacterized protein n=1 Tax=Castanea mollissima TaxID=60419 RepID=A0A8J4REH8_9ROSI|nr:hypothetical protein CMV_010816 [Castanea mollissima]